MKEFLLPFSLLIVFFVFAHTRFSGYSYAQKTDLPKNPTDTQSVKKHSPMTATLMSAVIPGLGQVYNKKYWKVPVIYGGLLTAGYFLKINREAYLDLKKAYIAEVDTDQATISHINLPVSALQSYMEFYRNRMEICYISLGLLYILNVVDATVDAHLFTFDVSDNLSLNFRPWIKNYSDFGKAPVSGMTLTLKL